MRKMLLCAAIMLVAATSAPSQAAARKEYAKLRAIYTAEWNWREAQFADDEDGQKPVVDHLPKVGPAAQTARLRYWLGVINKLDAIKRGKLSAAERLNYDVYKPQIADLIASQKFRDYEMPANSDSSFWTDLGYTARRPFTRLADYQGWIRQMRDIPRYFREEIEEMRAGEKRGFTPPRVTLEGRDGSIAAVANGTPQASLFYTPFVKMPNWIAPAQQASLKAEAADVIAKDVQPAYRDLLIFWNEEYVLGARTTLAAIDMPDGAAWYRAQIRQYTTLDMDPAAIHQLGVDEVAKLHAQMLDVMRETGFTGDFPAFVKFLRSDPRSTPRRRKSY
jgi:uncharacterized protein (DUF885 family)